MPGFFFRGGDKLRTREKGYSDYGFVDGESKLLKKWCRSTDFKYAKLLKECAEKANEAISSNIYNSILKGVSYDKLDQMEYQFYGKNDFYAYRRKTLALFRTKMIESGLYPF